MEDLPESEALKNPRPRCKNCDTKLSKQGNFCPGCGQRDFNGRVRMRDLLTRFFSNFTHLDNKFVKMCWHLFVPARVTLNYFQGKIKRYPHPVQFFFIVMFFFLLMFSKQFDGAHLNSTGGDFNIQVDGGDSTKSKEIEKNLGESGLYGAMQHFVAAKKYRAQFDSMPVAWRTPEARQLLDSVVRKIDGPSEDAARLILDLGKDSVELARDKSDSLTLNIIFSSAKIDVEDLISLPVETIIEQYGFKDWDQKIAVRQGIKSLKEPERLIHQYVGSFGWAILVLIALMSLVLGLFYWRQKKYYAEHFIFLMHQQSGVFLMLTLALVIQEYLFELSYVWFLIVAWIGVSLFLAMKRFYGGSWGWTIAKGLLFCALYLVVLLLLFVATLLVVFMIF
jgi:hypothetical protein